MPSSPIRKLAPFADAAKKEGVQVYHLNIGQPDIETPHIMMEAVQQANLKVLEYTDSRGIFRPIQCCVALMVIRPPCIAVV